ncbi:MAG: flagellar hook basal-body protein [Sphingomonadales bacterium]|nr:flagellar hook basal-body protein [Sphingomonadales bacterium]
MPDLVDSVTAILAQAQRRTEIAGENIANSTVPAYKRRVAFASLVTGADAARPVAPQILTAIDFRPGKLVESGNRYDFALAGPGFFAVRQDDALRYTRAGRFTRREDGRLVDPLGGVLQTAAGGDVVVSDADFQVKADGSIVQAGSEAGRIAVFDAADRTGLAPVDGGYTDNAGTLELSDAPHLVQGSWESANVTTGDEMVTMMQALRMAEAGQRVMMAYDDIMGRAIATFGESVK